jgi:hypothetical protein
MNSPASPKDEIWFLRVCHYISSGHYEETAFDVRDKETPLHMKQLNAGASGSPACLSMSLMTTTLKDFREFISL